MFLGYSLARRTLFLGVDAILLCSVLIARSAELSTSEVERHAVVCFSHFVCETAFATRHCKSLAARFDMVESRLYQQYGVQAQILTDQDTAWQLLAWQLPAWQPPA